MQKQEVSVDELVGQTLGSCHVERLLSRNRLSTVYLAQQTAQNRTVAITLFTVPEHFSAQARRRFIERFHSEAAALVQLDHEHLLPVYEYGDRFDYPYLVTPYVTGGSLSDVLKQRGRCTPTYTLQILEQVVAGLDDAHSRGVVHGALKPSNILTADMQAVQVAGFGLARILGMRGIVSSEHPDARFAHLLSITGTFLTAPGYIAPEFVLGQPVDIRSDIYALGIILFELLSGGPPFGGSEPLEVAMQHVERPMPALDVLCPDLSEELVGVVHHALERDPDRRFQYAGELANAFAQAVKGAENSGKWQLVPPIVTGHMLSVSSAQTEARTPLFNEEEAEADFGNADAGTARGGRRSLFRKRRPVRMSRRQAVALLATGGVAAVGTITIGGIGLAHLLGNMAHPQSAVVRSAPTYVERPPHATPAHNPITPTAGKPTAGPTSKPTPGPSHTGTVIGNTNQPVNSADDFNNPVDDEASLLVHLPGNSFVAFEKACTHEGVPVYYDAGSHTLVCPAHGSVFDPASGGKVIQGPANKPLPSVTIRVNADGTITTG